MTKGEQIANIIENSIFYKKHIFDFHWTSGSSTIVYPIQIWSDTREIELQLERDTLRGRWKNSLEKLISEINNKLGNNTIKEEYLISMNEDRSCPPTASIFYID